MSCPYGRFHVGLHKVGQASLPVYPSTLATVAVVTQP
jgi:hypothetical protein